MTHFYSLYSSEIYSIAIHLSYDGHLETKKNSVIAEPRIIGLRSLSPCGQAFPG